MAGIRTTVVSVDDEAIPSLLTGLARAHPAGGTVIERAAVVAAGADSEAVMTWILAHGGKPEAAVETSTRHGLHGSRLHSSGGSPPPGSFPFLVPPRAPDRLDRHVLAGPWLAQLLRRDQNSRCRAAEAESWRSASAPRELGLPR